MFGGSLEAAFRKLFKLLVDTTRYQPAPMSTLVVAYLVFKCGALGCKQQVMLLWLLSE